MKLFLIGWSVAAFGWWLTALVLLARGRRRAPVLAPASRAAVTVFKPLPPVRSEAQRQALAEAIGSFVSQLKAGDEVLLGMDRADAAGWQPVLDLWRAAFPAAAVSVVARDVPRQYPNPKISWLEVLAPFARGEVWLWSDADVSAPRGFLDEIGQRLAAGDCNAVTAPYKVPFAQRSSEVLDALFVNAEFLPGVLMLGSDKGQNFAYGAATAFRADTFRQHGDWQKLGTALADDHKLGELLQPVKLVGTMVATLAETGGWVKAWNHYYRWHKTVRWCRPAGYAGMVMILPAFGWATAIVFGADKIFFLAGLAAQLAGETVVGFLACRLVACRLAPASWPGVLLWPLVRAGTWLLVWLPLPVLWSGRQRAWFAPQGKK